MGLGIAISVEFLAVLIFFVIGIVNLYYKIVKRKDTFYTWAFAVFVSLVLYIFLTGGW